MEEKGHAARQRNNMQKSFKGRIMEPPPGKGIFAAAIIAEALRIGKDRSVLPVCALRAVLPGIFWIF
jgi:hypothetical protein